MDRSGGEVSFLAEWITVARPALCGGFPGSGTSEAFADCLPAADASAAAAENARTATTTAARGRRDTRRTNSFNCLSTDFSPGWSALTVAPVPGRDQRRPARAIYR